MNKIKILKGIEKICLAGLVAGTCLGYTGKVIKKDKLAIVGAGIAITSLAVGTYASNDRRNSEYEKHWEEQIKKHY